jgi:DNA-directed RNA polymerase subunit M
MVEFCPDCDSMLKKKKEGGDFVFKCDNCGFSKPYDKQAKAKNEELLKKKIEKKKLMYITQVREEGEKIENPITSVECPECKHTKAEYFQLQTRSADEPATTFYCCLQCGHKWRDYG